MPDIVSNTGPIIALTHIGQTELLRTLLGKVFVPALVRAEVKDETSLTALAAADWIVTQEVQDTFAARLLKHKNPRPHTQPFFG